MSVLKIPPPPINLDHSFLFVILFPNSLKVLTFESNTILAAVFHLLRGSPRCFWDVRKRRARDTAIEMIGCFLIIENKSQPDSSRTSFLSILFYCCKLRNVDVKMRVWRRKRRGVTDLPIQSRIRGNLFGSSMGTRWREDEGGCYFAVSFNAAIVYWRT